MLRLQKYRERKSVTTSFPFANIADKDFFKVTKQNSAVNNQVNSKSSEIKSIQLMYQNEKEKNQKLLCDLNKEKENLQKQTTNLMQNNDHLAQANNHLKRNLESSKFKIKDLNNQIDSLKLEINDLVDGRNELDQSLRDQSIHHKTAMEKLKSETEDNMQEKLKFENQINILSKMIGSFNYHDYNCSNHDLITDTKVDYISKIRNQDFDYYISGEHWSSIHPGCNPFDELDKCFCKDGDEQPPPYRRGKKQWRNHYPHKSNSNTNYRKPKFGIMGKILPGHF